jgi:hypothetical protein
MHGHIYCRALRRMRTHFGAALFTCALAGGGAGLASAHEDIAAAAIKAAIVAKLFLFVEWPDTSSGYRLCVAGRGETADAVMAEHDRMVKGQVIETVRLAAPDAVPGRRCKILFIAASAGGRAAEFAQATAGSAVLIVAEGDVLTSDRAHVLLTLEARRPVLSINLTEARRAGLDMSARLLQLARKVL